MTTDKKVCGAVYFGFEVVRCQLPAGHPDSWHEAAGLRWQPDSNRVQVRSYHIQIPKRSYQAELHKGATLKEG